MGKKGPLWWRESDWLLRGSSAANQILLRHSGPILSNTLLIIVLAESRTIYSQQESIPEVCILPALHCMGGSLSKGSPWTETPLEGTWDKAARQEVTSYRYHSVNGMTDTHF